MLDVVNRLADGFVSLPVIEACRRGGVLTALRDRRWTAPELSAALQANQGHLRVALRLLDSLGWVDGADDDRHALNDHGDRLSGALQPDMGAMLALLPTAVTEQTDRLVPWLDRCAEGWPADGAPSPLADLLDGALLAPVLAEIARRGGTAALEAGSTPLGRAATESFLRLLLRRGWATRNGPDIRLNTEGRYLADSGAKLATVVSYWPMLQQIHTLLFGAAAPVFGRDTDGHERHLDRRLNVTGSAAQHGTFFRQMEDAVVAYFDSLPVESQPTHIADLGCGDGSLLLRLYQAIVGRPARRQQRLAVIAADFNAVSLDLAGETLANVPHMLIQADIGDPAAFIAGIAARGVNPDGVLHIRSFVDHDRPLLPPRDQAGTERRQGIRDAGLHVDRAGDAIPPAAAIQSLVEHLQRWRSAASPHGMLLLEVHCLRARTVRRMRHETESLHFDAYHAFAGQHLVEAPTFLLAAAEAGFLPHAPTALRFPRFAGHTRITLNRFVARPYTIRIATRDDLRCLLALEAAALPGHLRGSDAQLLRRMTAFPEGQLLVETDGAVIGAVYSQRIAETSELDTVNVTTIEDLHRNDAPIVQLLLMVMHPDRPQGVQPDDLLGFALDYFAVMDGVYRVVGVTRCRDYARRADQTLDYRSYVAQRDRNGMPLDPILLMHASHGARIERIIDGFRPADIDNDGAGVLIDYDLERRSPGAPSQPLVQAGIAVESLVRETIERVLGSARRQVYRNDLPLTSMGLGSLELMELRRLLSEAVGTNLSSAIFFRHTTPDALIRYLRNQRAADAAPDAADDRPKAAGPDTMDGYAIIGLGCRFPGGATSPEAFWDRLMQGFDAVRQVPSDRWDADTPSWGGFLDTVDQFDAGFFNLSPREAMHMDPQQRLLLETAWEALEDAGQMTATLAGSATGVFIGAQNHSSDYYLMQAQDRGHFDTYTATGTAHSILANRISYLLDLRGPSMAIDTACSSSLVAIHTACQSLLTGDCDLALAGGVNLILTPDFSICLGKLEMLAPDGRCKTFDDRANGFVRGEGCGVVVLKRLADATRDRDPILAVIRGSAIVQDGASNGLTAPSGTAQEATVRRALKRARLSPDSVSYVETHGTGTMLGDPVEVEALANVLVPGPGHPCVLGAVKTNIGHLEAASGIAGLIKVVLSLQNQAIPPNLHLQAVNPHLASQAAGFVLPKDAQPWRSGGAPRIAGVSSFGFGGTNAHVVVSEAPAAEPTAGESRAMLLPVSARSEAALRHLVQAYIAFLGSARGQALAPADIAYTAARRRRHHAHRLCAIGADAMEWATSLRRQIDTTGTLSPAPALDVACLSGELGESRSQLEAAAALYVGGADTGWDTLCPTSGQCAQLPRYPWQRQRYWLPRTARPFATSDRTVRQDAPDDWFYRVTWQPDARQSGDRLPVFALTEANLPAAVLGLQAEGSPEAAAAIRRMLDERSVRFIWSALGELGADCSIGAVWPKTGTSRALGIQPRFERLLHRMTDILQAAGVLRDQQQGWLVASQPATQVHDVNLSAWPGAGDIMHFQARCGANLAKVLCGKTEPLSLLFSGDNQVSAEAIYRDAAPAKRGNRALAEAIRVWLAAMPPDRTLRVLEIGAGTGATTAALLPLLPKDRCEYVFTDVSPAFLRRGAAQFASRGGIRFERLDLEQPPSQQGFGPGQFDLVVAVNVLHATMDLSSSLAHINMLLADNGILALMECTAARSWMDICFGLTDGWWRFTDHALRQTHPLLPDSAWTGELGRSGYADICAVPLQGAQGDPLFDQSLLFARKPATAPAPAARPAATGRYLIVDDNPTLADALLQELADTGADARRWPAEHPPTDAVLDAASHGCEAIIYLAPDSLAQGADADLTGACLRPLRLIQALLNHKVTPRNRLWLVTRGSQPVGEISPALVNQSALWGLGRAAALEAPDLQPTLIDLDPAAPLRTAVQGLLDQIADRDGEDQVVLRGTERLVPRLERLPAGPKAPPLQVSGRHLITGGLGRIGCQLALHLARAGAAELVLLVNRPLPERATWQHLEPGTEAHARCDTVRTLDSMGVKVVIAPVDLTRDDALPAWFQSAAMAGNRLSGVWHTAMALSAHPIADLDQGTVRSMMQVKADAAWRLHELTRDHPLDHFVLFSSTTALWGARGLAHYAAANACLDALAHLRRSQGKPATVINWGIWDAAQPATAVQQQAQQVGLRPMPAPAAFDALGQALATEAIQAIVADIDWHRFISAYEARRPRPFLNGLRPRVEAASPGADKTDAHDTDDRFIHRLAAAPPDLRIQMLRSLIRQEVAAILGLEPDALLDARKGFFEFGMDSLTSLQLRRRLEQALGRPLPSTLAFNYPTIEALASYLSWTPVPDAVPAPAPVPPPDPPAAPVFDEGEETEDELFAQLAARLAPGFA